MLMLIILMLMLMLIECLGREWAVLKEPADRRGRVFYFLETDKNKIVFS